MNAETKIEPGTDIVVAVAQDHSIVLFDEAKFDAWIRAKRDGAPTGLDMAQKKNRDEIRSYAQDLRTERASIKRDRLKLTEEWRTMTAKVNEAGKAIDEQIEALIEEIRGPLTEWEDAEKARVDECEAMIARIKAAATVTLDDTADTVRARGMDIYATKDEIAEDRYRDLYEQAMQARSDTIGALKTALDRLTREEAERAELERLRAAEEARLAREAEERAEREAQQRAEQEAREAEERRVAAEKAEQERIERAKQEAAEAERRRIEAEHQAQIDAERKAADAARHSASMLQYIAEVVAGRIGGEPQPFGVLLRELESKVLSEIERCGDMREQVEKARVEGLATLNRMMKERQERRAQEEAREAERLRLEAEHNRKLADEANKALQRRLKTEAKEAIMSCGVSEEAAQKIVIAIRAKEIPHVVWSM